MGQHSTIHAKTTESIEGKDGKWVALRANSAGNLITAPVAGEFAQFNRTGAGPIVKYVTVGADTAVVSGAAILYGIFCVSAGTMAAVYDNTAASGTLLIPSSALTAGQSVTFGGMGVLCNTGIYADWTSGSFLVLYVDAA